MKKNILFVVTALLIFTGLINGCSLQEEIQTSPTPLVRSTEEEVFPDDIVPVEGCLMAPNVRGTVLEVEGLGILVEAKNELGDQVEGEIWITITDETYFFEDVDQQSSIGIMDVSRDFKVGNNVVMVTGPVAESYPMQAEALSVYENNEE